MLIKLKTLIHVKTLSPSIDLSSGFQNRLQYQIKAKFAEIAFDSNTPGKRAFTNFAITIYSRVISGASHNIFITYYALQ